jgi:hypothetical protein
MSIAGNQRAAEPVCGSAQGQLMIAIKPVHHLPLQTHIVLTERVFIYVG